MPIRNFSWRSPDRGRARWGMASVLAMVFVLMAWPAHAYIDPGSASIILQAIVGGLAAGAFALKLYWQRVRRFFGFKPKESEKENGRAGP